MAEGTPTGGTWTGNQNTAAQSMRYYTAARNWQYCGQPSGKLYETFVFPKLPADIDGRQVISAHLLVNVVPVAGANRTMTVQRHAKPTTSYAAMTFLNRPGALAGSTAKSITQSPATQVWSFDVKDDLQAIALGAEFYGFRITSAVNAQWALYGWASAYPVQLVVVLADYPPQPTNVRPDGTTSLTAPVFTWLAPSGLLSAQVQLDVVGGDFSSPLWDSGVQNTTVAQLDSAALGWTGQADGASVIARIRQTTDIGTSDWSLPVTVTRRAAVGLAIISPASTTTDPTPTVAWTTTDQQRWQVLVYLGGKLLIDSGVHPGNDTAYTLPKGAAKAGDSLLIYVRVWDSVARTASPGDPGYVEASVTSVYNPGAAAAISTLMATQIGVTPAVELDWTRAAGVADEWLISRDGVHVARIPGVSGGDPVLSWRTWENAPNRDVTYTVQPIVGGSVGALGPTVVIRTEVDGEWVIDPDTERMFSTTGENSQLVYGESTVTYTTTGGPKTITRTYALRGLEGPGGGTLMDYDGRTVHEQEDDLFSIKGQPSLVIRYVMGDINIPATLKEISPIFDKDRGFTDNVVKQVTFTVTQDDDLPFPAVPQ